MAPRKALILVPAVAILAAMASVKAEPHLRHEHALHKFDEEQGFNQPANNGGAYDGGRGLTEDKKDHKYDEGYNSEAGFGPTAGGGAFGGGRRRVFLRRLYDQGPDDEGSFEDISNNATAANSTVANATEANATSRMLRSYVPTQVRILAPPTSTRKFFRSE